MTLSLDPVQISATLVRQGHVTATPAKVTAALANINVAAVVATHRARITTALWDGASPINGCSAELIRAQPNHNHGPIYTMEIDGKIAYIQPFEPGVSGFVPIDPATWATTASAHADTVAESAASADIFKQVAAAV